MNHIARKPGVLGQRVRSGRLRNVSIGLALAIWATALAGSFSSPAVLLAQKETRPPSSAIHFTDASAEAGIPPGEYKSFGVTWGDYDGDGWVDLFLNNHFLNSPFLLHNNGNGTFTERAIEAGLAVYTDRHGCAWGDIEGDSYLDLFCTAGGEHGTGSKAAQLWRNNRDGTFTDVAAAMGVQDGPGRNRTVDWFDWDGDRDLDLYVANFVEQPDQPPSRLFRNNGAVFTDVASFAGLAVSATLRCGAMADYDGDNAIDLVVSPGPDYGDPVLYHNQGDGTYAQVPASVSGMSGEMLQSLAWGDYDNDGSVDLFAGRAHGDYGHSRLYHNNGDGTFTDVLRDARLSSVDVFRPILNATWFDADNDGDLDLFVVRGRNPENSEADDPRDVLYRNNGDGTFTDVTVRAGVAGNANGGGDGAAAADYDKDGFMDLVVSNGDAPFRGAYQLFHNVGNRNHWLNVQLVGTQSNVLAIGSKIWIRIGRKTQYREYLDFVACHSQNEQMAHFGLGTSTTVDLLRVRWPNGQVQKWENIAADQFLRLVQPYGAKLVYLPAIMK